MHAGNVCFPNDWVAAILNVDWGVCSLLRHLANISVTLLPLLYHMWRLQCVWNNNLAMWIERFVSNILCYEWIPYQLSKRIIGWWQNAVLFWSSSLTGCCWNRHERSSGTGWLRGSAQPQTADTHKLAGSVSLIITACDFPLGSPALIRTVIDSM